MIMFDVPMAAPRFQQKYGFTMPSKLALGNVVVYGRDKYDGLEAVKRFRVVGYRLCQVYVGYDDWRKNVAEEERRLSTGSGDEVGSATNGRYECDPSAREHMGDNKILPHFGS
jgi:hypothetical protein